jgi:hypothetical protein
MDQLVELEGFDLAGAVAREPHAHVLEEPRRLGLVVRADRLAISPALRLRALLGHDPATVWRRAGEAQGWSAGSVGCRPLR